MYPYYFRCITVMCTVILLRIWRPRSSVAKVVVLLLCPGAPVAQWVKRWPTDLAVVSSSSA